MKALDLTGHRFGRLTVEERGPDKGGNSYWWCLCECGERRLVFRGSLRSGRTKSCGCLGRELAKERFVANVLPLGQVPKDVVAYSAAHYRVYSAKGSSRDHLCECGDVAEHWAYDHSDPNGLVSQEKQSFGLAYSLDPAYYQPMCVPCHRKFDSGRRAG